MVLHCTSEAPPRGGGTLLWNPAAGACAAAKVMGYDGVEIVGLPTTASRRKNEPFAILFRKHPNYMQ